jgi:hypothetical protein
MNSLVVYGQMALLTELLVTLGALVVVGLARIVSTIFVKAQRLVLAEPSQTNLTLRTAWTIVYGCLAQRVHGNED